MESIFVKLAQYPSIETERLLLRPVTLDDAEAMFDYASDKGNTRYTFPTNQSLKKPRITLLSSIWLIPWDVGNRTKKQWSVYWNH